MLTAASSASASPARYARAQRSAFRLAVAEMHPANGPLRASINVASVEGNTAKPGAIAAIAREYARSPEESFRPAIRAPNFDRTRATSSGLQARPDRAGKL